LNYQNIIISILPPILAILLSITGPAQKRFLSFKVNSICKKNDRLKGLEEVILNSSLAAILITNYFLSAITFLLYILIAFYHWPTDFRFVSAAIIIAAIIIMIVPNIFSLLSLDIHEVASLKVQKRQFIILRKFPILSKIPGISLRTRGFLNKTYEQHFSRHLLYFNCLLVMIIVFGYFLESPTGKKILSKTTTQQTSVQQSPSFPTQPGPTP
jgi:hypothetical protein